MFINIQDNRHFRKLLTKQKYSSVVTKIFNQLSILITMRTEDVFLENHRFLQINKFAISVNFVVFNPNFI